jgi:hypothetical protein
MVDEMPRRTALDHQPDPDGVLAQLHALVAARKEIERREAALVRRARNEGIVWEQIASSLGVTKQAVHKKYRGTRPGLRRALR